MLERRAAEEGLILTQAQVEALEKKEQEDEAELLSKVVDGPAYPQADISGFHGLLQQLLSTHPHHFIQSAGSRFFRWTKPHLARILFHGRILRVWACGLHAASHKLQPKDTPSSLSLPSTTFEHSSSSSEDFGAYDRTYLRRFAFSGLPTQNKLSNVYSAISLNSCIVFRFPSAFQSQTRESEEH